MATSAIARLQTIGDNPAANSDLFPMASSTVLGNASGRFVTGASGIFALTTGSDTQIDGWVDDCYSITHDGTQGTSPLTTSSTSGGTKVTGTKQVHSDGYEYWIPFKAGSTKDDTVVGKLCDLDVTSNVQSVDTTTTTRKSVKIIAVDASASLALVRANI